MIKNTIIVILLLLLIITFYAYLCLSNNMTNFQKERMEYIYKKEADIKQKEQSLVSLTECNNNMNKYKDIIKKVSSDLTKTTEDFGNVVKYINQVNDTIKTDVSQVNSEILNESTKNKEHFGNLENNTDLDKPIEDAFVTALDF